MLDRIFGLNRAGVSAKDELRAALTTFVTMAYIIIVNPAVLEAAGIPRGPSVVATILTAAFGSIVMGLYAGRPFAIAPYMGENAFIAYTVCKVMGHSWQQALAAVFLAGVLFFIMTVAGVRSWLADAIPKGLKYSFAAGIGLFLAFIGLNETGIITLGVQGAPVKMGDIGSTQCLLGISGFIVIILLMIYRIKSALLIGIGLVTVLSMTIGVSTPPEHIISLPPSLSPILFKLDFSAAFSWSFGVVLLTVFVMAFVDTIGTLIGVGSRAGFLDENGNLPEIEKPMAADAISTVFAALVGTTTAGAYIESAAGIEAGGRTGLTAVLVGILFLVSLFFTPLAASVPPYAYGPALIAVGAFMMKSVTKIDFDDYTELFPAFVVIVLMSFTYNIGLGMTAGFVLYPILKTAAGKRKEIKPGMWILFAMAALFFVFYPNT